MSGTADGAPRRLPDPPRHGVAVDRDDVVDPETRVCEFCGAVLSRNTGWSHAGLGFRWELETSLCPDCRLDGRGTVTVVEISRGDDVPRMPGDDPFEMLQSKLERSRSPTGVAQSTFQPALALDPAVFPDGTYHFVRVDTYTVEFRPPVGTTKADVLDWASAWDWTENVDVRFGTREFLDVPVIRFEDAVFGVQ